MKKLAFMLAVVFLSVAAFGQQKQTTPSSKSKSDTTMTHKKTGTSTNSNWDKNKTGKKDMTKAKKDTTKMKKN